MGCTRLYTLASLDAPSGLRESSKFFHFLYVNVLREQFMQKELKGGEPKNIRAFSDIEESRVGSQQNHIQCLAQKVRIRTLGAARRVDASSSHLLRPSAVHL